MRANARLLITLLLAVMTTLAVIRALPPARHADNPTDASSNAVLFAASFPDANGNMQALSQWRGQVLVVNFWATWCPPCREEMPELSRLQEKYQTRGLRIVGIATDDAGKLREFVQQNPVSYPLLAGDSEASNLAAAMGNNQSVLPYTVVIGRDGKVLASYFGLLDIPALEQALQPLLNTPS